MADLQDLLVKSSRTFALSIPLLPEPTRGEVTIAYLLFRIADTFEDASVWPAARQVQALADFDEVLKVHDPDRTRRLVGEWMQDPPAEHEGYLELLRETEAVLEAHCALSAEARAIIEHHVLRTSRGMADYVRRRAGTQGELELQRLDDLRHYCYIVAGIVGEMLTDLFILGCPTLQPLGSQLRSRSRDFGEGLQLVNILKDSADDAVEGRSFLPPGVPRSEVFALARHDLRRAQEYVLVLQKGEAPRGVLEFNALPVLLAWATLDVVEEKGPGSKISRETVADLVNRMHQALDRGEPAVWEVRSSPAQG